MMIIIIIKNLYYKCLSSALRNCFMSTFRISYYPHFYHRVLSLKIPCANNQALSSNNLGLLREKAGLFFLFIFEKKVAKMFGILRYFLYLCIVLKTQCK